MWKYFQFMQIKKRRYCPTCIGFAFEGSNVDNYLHY